VTDEAPADPAPPPPPPPAPDVAVDDTPTPPPADVVAPEQNAPPPPDAAPDDIVREEVVQDDTSEPEIEQPEEEPTAPEETTTEIVNQDDEPAAPAEPEVAAAPTTSMRPSARPSRPTPTPAAAPEETQTAEAETPEVVEPDTDEAVAAALEAALAASEEPAVTDNPNVALGREWSGAEREGFRLAVTRCWNVDRGSVAARVTVDIGIEFNRDGTVVADSIEFEGFSGDETAARTAFEAGRRAILRCQSGGYELNPETYEQWRAVVVRFDPSEMR